MSRAMINAVKQFIREPYAWPGGYPKILVMADGECLCPKCARANFRAIVAATKAGLRDGWKADGVGIHWEGAPVYCAQCNVATLSAYGRPGAPDDDEVQP
jgi:hypothetical protein